MSGSPACDPADAAREVAASWYVPELPAPPAGWLVFSEEFVLRILQRRWGQPVPVCRSLPWRLAAGMLRAAMGAAQVVLMVVARIPLLGGLYGAMAGAWPRGAVGFFLRACYFKARLRRLGPDTLIEPGVEIWGPANVEIGARCHLDSGVKLSAGEGTHGQHGHIRIGNFTHIGPRCQIAGRGGVQIGDGVTLQAAVHVYSATATLLDPAEPGRLVSFSHVTPPGFHYIVEAPVRIDDYAMVGFACLLLPGAQVGRAAVIHPYCIVSRAFPPFANVVGPGRARQNGWRRPPRLDPRSPAAAGRNPAQGETSA